VRRILLLFLAAACGDTSPTDPAPAAPRRVLLITIDTLRADAVGDDTPAITGFLQRATRYAGARTPIPLTLPAHLTLLSGLEPLRHGVLDNAAPPLPADRGYRLLAEELGAKGFATAAFVSCAVLGPKTGIAAGFQTYECPEFGARWSGDPGDIAADRRLDGALAWLGSVPEDQPWFLWVHFFDPHDPYRPFDGDAKRRGTKATDSVRELYAGEVRRVDAAIERLLAATPNDALTVIASDHGESLDEHGEPTHGSLCYATTMDVFLAVSGTPGVDTQPRGLAFATDLMRGTEPREPGVQVGFSLLAWRTHGWGQVLSAYDGRYSLIETGPRLELFDRDADPFERTPLDPSGHAAYEKLDRALRDLRQRGRGSSEELLTDSASPYGSVRRPFSELLPRDRNLELADPGRGFAFGAELARGKRLLYMRQFAAAAAIFERLGKQDAVSPAPFHYLAFAQSGLGDHGDASVSAREAIRRGYKVAPLLHQLLSAAVAAGTRHELELALETALQVRIVPDLPCAEQIVKVCLALDDAEARQLGRTFLERMQRRAATPADRKRVSALHAALQ